MITEKIFSETFIKSQEKPIKKIGILLVAYGSSHVQASSAVRSFQVRLEKYFNMPVRLAFTSETMRKRLAHARTKSDSVLKALEKMNFEHFSHVAVQGLHLIAGIEYSDVLEDISLAREKIPLFIATGYPLLSQKEDIDFVAKALQSLVPKNFAESDKLLWMGHGTKHGAKSFYTSIAHAVNSLDNRLFIACMEGENTLSHVLEKWNMEKKSEHKSSENQEKVWLLPLLANIGRHALHDMAGDHEESWKSRIEKAGYLCQVHMHGLAESTTIQDIWIDRLSSAINTLKNKSLL